MPRINYTTTLQEEYAELHTGMEIKPIELAIVEDHADKIPAAKSRYEEVGGPLGIPWYFIALVHTLEANRDFSSHLHNGDTLTRRTPHVPAGRPRSGSAPFDWEESARDALEYKGLHHETDWSLSKTLYHLEKYNGWGYHLYHRHVKSPYLWSYSDHNTSGKYIADGTFSDTAVSRQCGAVVILRRLEQRGIIRPFGSAPKKSFFFLSRKKEPRVDELQRFLNGFPGIALMVDGNPGPKTSEACFKVMGEYLRGDGRIVASPV